MKKHLFTFSRLFALLGGCLGAGAIAICITQRHAAPKILGSTPRAALCAQNFLDTLERGDFSGASGFLYGCPGLCPDNSAAGEAGKLVWDAFSSGLACSDIGACYPAEEGIRMDVTIVGLDIPAILQSMERSAPEFLESTISRTKRMSDVYDESHNYREDFLQSVIRSCAENALENAVPSERSLSLTLVHGDGRWWILPDEALLCTLSGGILG